MSVEDHPYASFIERVRKPSQYLGGEHGAVRKPWDAVDCRLCLAFPDLYEIGMSHLGTKILYGIVNGHAKLLAERAFAPWQDMESELRSRQQPLRSLESARPLADFDVVGFSLQFELTYTNILLMLDLGGIPLWSAERGEDDPLIVAGGPTATHPEPIAPFIDAFLIGDGEDRTPEMMLLWSALKRAGVPRAERLRRLAESGGWYVPSLYEVQQAPETGMWVVSGSEAGAPFPVQRSFLRDINAYPFPHDGPVAATETIFDRVSVEIARGCTEGCRFCQAGMIYRPVRERTPDAIVETLTRAIREGGYDEASLTSLSTADYSAIAPLVREIAGRLRDDRVSLSVSSLRAYGLESDVLDDIAQTGMSGLTFAPEAGTQRMRDVVNKNVTEEQLLETAERVFSKGWSQMKLYFMIGLPTEEDEDVRGIVGTAARALGVGRRIRGKGGARVTASVSTHVPKPHTPFQWCAMDAHEQIVRKQNLLRDEVRKTKVRLRMHDSTGSWLEGVLARGDRRLAQVLATAYSNGARFDSWDECLRLDVWRGAMAEHGVDPSVYLGTLPTSSRLPWDHIDVGLEDGFLAREYRKALRNRLSPPCGKAVGAFVHHTNVEDAERDTRKLVCYDCGVACDLTHMRQERVTYLRTLGAMSPRAAEAPAAGSPAAGSENREAPLPVGRRQPAPGPRVRARLGYTKLGRAAFRGHLDLVRLLPRVFKRAGLPVRFTNGFHPKPDMTFGPALSLGVASFAEYIDVALEPGEYGPDDRFLLERLHRATFEGVDFFGARLLESSDRALPRVIDEASYVAALPRSTLAELGFDERAASGPAGRAGVCAALEDRIARAREQGLVVLRERKGLGRRIDVGDYLVDVRVGDGDAALGRAGLVGDLVPLTLRMRVAQQGGVRLQEALWALLRDRPSEKVTPLSARWVRTGLYSVESGRPVAPLEVETLRDMASRKADATAVQAVSA